MAMSKRTPASCPAMASNPYGCSNSVAGSHSRAPEFPKACRVRQGQQAGRTSARLRTCSTHASASSSQVLRFSSMRPGPAAVCAGSVHCVGSVSTTHSLSCWLAACVPSEMLGPGPEPVTTQCDLSLTGVAHCPQQYVITFMGIGSTSCAWTQSS